MVGLKETTMPNRRRLQMVQGRCSLGEEMSSLRIMVLLLLACVTVFTASNVLATTYYVSTSGNDGNPGTQGSPWRTMTKAAATMVAGDTTLVQDGTYEEDSVRVSTSGTEANRITLKAQNSRRAILSSLSSHNCQPAINIHAPYIVIEGIRIQTSPNASPCGVYSAANLSIRVWHDESVNPPSINGTQSSGYVGTIIRDVQVDPNPDRCCAIKTSQDYTIVENSLLYDELEGFNSRGVIYRNNIIYHGGAAGNYISCKGGCRNTMLYGNIVHITSVKTPASWALGLSCGQVSGPQWDYDPSTSIESYNCVAFNNVIINDSNSPSVLGMMSQGSDISLFSNNILVNGVKYGNLNSGGGRPPSNTTLRNNIFICNGQSALGGGTINGYFDVDYNNFYNCSGVPSQAHPITGDPRFVNSLSDWHLQSGSPAIGAGTPVTMTGYYGESMDVSKDFAGVTRSVPWSLGIYTGNSQSADTTPPPIVTGVRIQ